MLDAALEYAAMGWHVMPLHGVVAGACTCGDAACSSPGKHPRTVHGLKDASCNPESVRRWWKKWPDANVGIVTGAASGLVVLDLDTDDLTVLEANDIELPETRTAKTARGRHLFFRHPGTPVANRAGILPKVDVRGDGGYVVAPPSRHISGHVYAWLNEDEILPMPEWLLRLLDGASGGKAANQAKPLPSSGPITEGTRHATLLSFAGAWRAKGHDKHQILALLELENRRCVPPCAIRLYLRAHSTIF